MSEPLFDVGDDECVERVDGDLHLLCAHVVEQELHVAQLASVRTRPHYVRKGLLFTQCYVRLLYYLLLYYFWQRGSSALKMAALKYT